ncbi:hypothetical protein HDU98_010875, partial [Podochytrium sp. JEL0797]
MGPQEEERQTQRVSKRRSVAHWPSVSQLIQLHSEEQRMQTTSKPNTSITQERTHSLKSVFSKDDEALPLPRATSTPPSSLHRSRQLPAPANWNTSPILATPPKKSHSAISDKSHDATTTSSFFESSKGHSSTEDSSATTTFAKYSSSPTESLQISFPSNTESANTMSRSKSSPFPHAAATASPPEILLYRDTVPAQPVSVSALRNHFASPPPPPASILNPPVPPPPRQKLTPTINENSSAFFASSLQSQPAIESHQVDEDGLMPKAFYKHQFGDVVGELSFHLKMREGRLKEEAAAREATGPGAKKKKREGVVSVQEILEMAAVSAAVASDSGDAGSSLTLPSSPPPSASEPIYIPPATPAADMPRRISMASVSSSAEDAYSWAAGASSCGGSSVASDSMSFEESSGGEQEEDEEVAVSAAREESDEEDEAREVFFVESGGAGVEVGRPGSMTSSMDRFLFPIFEGEEEDEEVERGYEDVWRGGGGGREVSMESLVTPTEKGVGVFGGVEGLGNGDGRGWESHRGENSYEPYGREDVRRGDGGYGRDNGYDEEESMEVEVVTLSALEEQDKRYRRLSAAGVVDAPNGECTDALPQHAAAAVAEEEASVSMEAEVVTLGALMEQEKRYRRLSQLWNQAGDDEQASTTMGQEEKEAPRGALGMGMDASQVELKIAEVSIQDPGVVEFVEEKVSPLAAASSMKSIFQRLFGAAAAASAQSGQKPDERVSLLDDVHEQTEPTSASTSLSLETTPRAVVAGPKQPTDAGGKDTPNALSVSESWSDNHHSGESTATDGGVVQSPPLRDGRGKRNSVQSLFQRVFLPSARVNDGDKNEEDEEEEEDAQVSGYAKLSNESDDDDTPPAHSGSSEESIVSNVTVRGIESAPPVAAPVVAAVPEVGLGTEEGGNLRPDEESRVLTTEKAPAVVPLAPLEPSPPANDSSEEPELDPEFDWALDPTTTTTLSTHDSLGDEILSKIKASRPVRSKQSIQQLKQVLRVIDCAIEEDASSCDGRSVRSMASRGSMGNIGGRVGGEEGEEFGVLNSEGVGGAVGGNGDEMGVESAVDSNSWVDSTDTVRASSRGMSDWDSHAANPSLPGQPPSVCEDGAAPGSRDEPTLIAAEVGVPAHEEAFAVIAPPPPPPSSSRSALRQMPAFTFLKQKPAEEVIGLPETAVVNSPSDVDLPLSPRVSNSSVPPSAPPVNVVVDSRAGNALVEDAIVFQPPPPRGHASSSRPSLFSVFSSWPPQPDSIPETTVVVQEAAQPRGVQADELIPMPNPPAILNRFSSPEPEPTTTAIVQESTTSNPRDVTPPPPPSFPPPTFAKRKSSLNPQSERDHVPIPDHVPVPETLPHDADAPDSSFDYASGLNTARHKVSLVAGVKPVILEVEELSVPMVESPIVRFDAVPPRVSSDRVLIPDTLPHDAEAPASSFDYAAGLNTARHKVSSVVGVKPVTLEVEELPVPMAESPVGRLDVVPPLISSDRVPIPDTLPHDAEAPASSFDYAAGLNTARHKISLVVGVKPVTLEVEELSVPIVEPPVVRLDVVPPRVSSRHVREESSTADVTTAVPLVVENAGSLPVEDNGVGESSWRMDGAEVEEPGLDEARSRGVWEDPVVVQEETVPQVSPAASATEMREISGVDMAVDPVSLMDSVDMVEELVAAGDASEPSFSFSSFLNSRNRLSPRLAETALADTEVSREVIEEGAVPVLVEGNVAARSVEGIVPVLIAEGGNEDVPLMESKGVAPHVVESVESAISHEPERVPSDVQESKQTSEKLIATVPDDPESFVIVEDAAIPNASFAEFLKPQHSPQLQDSGVVLPPVSERLLDAETPPAVGVDSAALVRDVPEPPTAFNFSTFLNSRNRLSPHLDDTLLAVPQISNVVEEVVIPVEEVCVPSPVMEVVASQEVVVPGSTQEQDAAPPFSFSTFLNSRKQASPRLMETPLAVAEISNLVVEGAVAPFAVQEDSVPRSIGKAVDAPLADLKDATPILALEGVESAISAETALPEPEATTYAIPEIATLSTTSSDAAPVSEQLKSAPVGQDQEPTTDRHSMFQFSTFSTPPVKSTSPPMPFDDAPAPHVSAEERTKGLASGVEPLEMPIPYPPPPPRPPSWTKPGSLPPTPTTALSAIGEVAALASVADGGVGSVVVGSRGEPAMGVVTISPRTTKEPGPEEESERKDVQRSIAFGVVAESAVLPSVDEGNEAVAMDEGGVAVELEREPTPPLPALSMPAVLTRGFSFLSDSKALPPSGSGDCEDVVEVPEVVEEVVVAEKLGGRGVAASELKDEASAMGIGVSAVEVGRLDGERVVAETGVRVDGMRELQRDPVEVVAEQDGSMKAVANVAATDRDVSIPGDEATPSGSGGLFSFLWGTAAKTTEPASVISKPVVVAEVGVVPTTAGVKSETTRDIFAPRDLEAVAIMSASREASFAPLITPAETNAANFVAGVENLELTVPESTFASQEISDVVVPAKNSAELGIAKDDTSNPAGSPSKLFGATRSIPGVTLDSQHKESVAAPDATGAMMEVSAAEKTLEATTDALVKGVAEKADGQPEVNTVVELAEPDGVLDILRALLLLMFILFVLYQTVWMAFLRPLCGLVLHVFDP